MNLSSIDKVEGPNLTLRLIQPEDAAYVHGLRTNPAYNSHLSKVTGAVEDQWRWIEAYKTQEAARRARYYVIERKDGARCGLVRLYDIRADRFTWGSWILDWNKPPKAALESALLSFGIGFDILRRHFGNVDVRVENTHAEAFYCRFGMTETHRTDGDIFFVYSRERFEADRKTHLDILQQEACQ